MTYYFNKEEDNKFVCPSDRQLSLRAELKTGWSCRKTNNNPLDPAEQEAILQVIRRNEDIESTERERIGKLVDRVEQMKQRVVDLGPNNCRFCGTAFNIFTSSRILCQQCSSSVCSKCIINVSSKYAKTPIYLCRICLETREMLKKTGAWFFKGLSGGYHVTH